MKKTAWWKLTSVSVSVDLLTSLCEHGLPTGDLYEFAALMVLKFEKKWKAKQRQAALKAKSTSEPPNRKAEDEERKARAKGESPKKPAEESKGPQRKEETKKKGPEEAKGAAKPKAKPEADPKSKEPTNRSPRPKK